MFKAMLVASGPITLECVSEAWPRRPELSTAVPVAATPAPLRNERREKPWELSGGDDLCFDMRPPPKAWETFYSALLWLSTPADVLPGITPKKVEVLAQFFPVPHRGGGLEGETKSELMAQHTNLSAVMRLVGNHVGAHGHS